MAKLSALRKAEREKRKAARERFKVTKSAASKYERQLRSVAKQIGVIVSGLAPDGAIKDVGKLQEALRQYSVLLRPWAASVAERMIAEADQRDKRKWAQAAQEIGHTMRVELQTTRIGKTYQDLMQEQVTLITSLPLDAAERVHKLTLQAMVEGRRANEVAREILRTGEVSTSRAMLIARTEVARTSSVLTESRAKYIGSNTYIWRTSGDSDVRELHKQLNGQIIRWDAPPIAGENGERAHAGQIYNCFPGDTPVSLACGIKRLWRVFYTGEFVNINVAGHLITATPNHPVLTTRGWVAAGLIKQGDNVVCVLPQKLNVVDDDKYNVLPTIKEIFYALIPSLRTRPGSSFKSNFHGDVFDGDVNEVSVDFLLTLNTESVSLKEFRDFILTWTDGRVSGSQCLQVTESSFPGVSNVVRVLLWSPHGVHKLVSFNLCSSFDPVTAQDVLYSLRNALAAFSNKRSAITSAVECDHLRLVDVSSLVMSARSDVLDHDTSFTEVLAQNVSIAADSSCRLFERSAGLYHCLSVEDVSFVNGSSHVYTLESYNGWFSVAPIGILSKNCRCYPEPILPDIIE